MTTREEFKGLVNNLVRSVDHTQYASGCIEERVALLAAYDAQAARIAELERECDKVAAVLLERGCDGVVSECAAMEARIAELEAALNALYEHTKNNRQICGLNERARTVLSKEA